jgi:tetratricopeptide (TPR) repeat protein
VRLILVDVPGLDWPLIDTLGGEHPASWFSQVRSHGAHGTLTGLTPTIDESLATSLVSGQRPPEHGIHGAWRLDGDQIRPQHAGDSRCPGLWDAVAASGRQSLVIDWPGFPALDVSGAWVAPAWFDHGRLDGLSDAGLASELTDLRLDAASLSPASLLPFVGDLQASARRPGIDLLASAVARHASVQSAATRLMKGGDWSLLLLRYDLISRLTPRFMAHAPPALTQASETEFGAGVIPAALRLIDLSLARLAELAGDETAFLLVSCHGTRRGRQSPPPDSPAAAWQTEQGLIGLIGPGVAAGVRTWGADLTDVLPTALRLLGSAPPGRLPGRCLHEAFESTAPATESPLDRPTLERAQAVPVIGALPELGAAPERSELAREIDRREAMALLQSGDAAGARPLLERLHQAAPDERRFQLHLARCLFALGESGRAADLARAFLIEGDQEPRAHLILGLIELEQRRPDHALTHFFQAEQTCTDSAVVHSRIGEAYLLAQRPEEARRGFERALAVDDHHAPAHDGMARAWLQEGNDERAVESALAAIELDYRQVSAHFHLGVALARLDRFTESLSAFNQCLALDPDRVEAHQWLAELHRRVTGDMLEAARHQLIADQQARRGESSRSRPLPI